MIAIDRADMVAAGQVGLMAACGVATLLCGLGFVILTGANLILILRLLLVGFAWPGATAADLGLALLVPAAWFLACRGIVTGMNAVYDPSIRATLVLLAQCGGVTGMVMLLIGGIW